MIAQGRAVKVATAIGIAACALAIGWLFAPRFLPWDLLYRGEIRKGNELVARIESFKARHGRLPDVANVTEVLNLGFELRVGYHPDYQVSGESYELSYAFGFDGPTIKYSSRSGNWYCELCR